MTWRASAAEGLRAACGADGSFSLFSERFGEGFHGAIGARREAELKFVAAAQLERFAPGAVLQVVDVCVGLGTNSAALLEACLRRGLRQRWWGLELDRRPLALALQAPSFRDQWAGPGLAVLEQLQADSRWSSTAAGQGRMLWGDARCTLPSLLAEQRGQCDVVLLDAFSPRHCPQLWSLEFLRDLAALLRPDGRLITYCSAAAVRCSLQLAGLQLAAIGSEHTSSGTGTSPGSNLGQAWSLGTVASPKPLPDLDANNGVLRALSPMEREHLRTRAAEPYRDPSRRASAAAILKNRERDQASSAAGSTSAWRRRWGLEPGRDA
jgi:tRNA U34 5-methylaminomethyl-2-thiouridine-forming methyltransferase MnmC